MRIQYSILGILILLCLLAVGLAIYTQYETWPQIAERLNFHRKNIETGNDVDSAYDALRVELESGSDFGRMYAATVFGDLGPEASRAVPWLTQSLNDRDPVVRRESALALSNIGPASEPAMDELMKTIRRSNSDAAWFAADAMGNIGSPAIPHLPGLKTQLKNTRTKYGVDAPFTVSLETAIAKIEKFVE